jgi:hypothetical protein
MTLAMLAYAFLVVTAAIERARHPVPVAWSICLATRSSGCSRPVIDLGHRLRWSDWRRRHQVRALSCHYRRQAGGPS